MTAALVNGVFGDPLLHLRLRHRKRSLLFDLGEAGRLPARIAHQVTDVFISHAHFDHIAGFLWLLRSRIGILEPCRVFGPPGLAGNIQGLINGIHWDRIGERGPRFAVTEIHGDRLVNQEVQAGRPQPRRPAEWRRDDDTLLRDAEMRIRAITLDHRTPVIAYAFDPPRTLNVRKDRLIEHGLETGPWLGKLKRCIMENQQDVTIDMPNGKSEAAGTLANELLLITPGRKLVYATDLADTPDNRQKLTAFASGAHTLFCEAVFLSRDAEQAERTGHLTARACGEIATAAGVQHLIPFHFSRRYEKEPARLYDELRAACPRVQLPPAEPESRPI